MTKLLSINAFLLCMARCSYKQTCSV